MPLLPQSSPLSTSSHHHGSMMPRARPVEQYHHDDLHGHLGVTSRQLYHQDGWRTPTIEDPEHRANRPKIAAVQPPYHRGSLVPAIREKNEDDQKPEKPRILVWTQRMKHVTWAWFTLTMATGGIANVLHTGNALFAFRLQSAAADEEFNLQSLTDFMDSMRLAWSRCSSTSYSTSLYGL